MGSITSLRTIECTTTLLRRRFVVRGQDSGQRQTRDVSPRARVDTVQCLVLLRGTWTKFQNGVFVSRQQFSFMLRPTARTVHNSMFALWPGDWLNFSTFKPATFGYGGQRAASEAGHIANTNVGCKALSEMNFLNL